jgi:hypothetical protein
MSSCGPAPGRNSGDLELRLSSDMVKLTPGQTVDVTVTLHTTTTLGAPLVMSLRSPGDQALPDGLNAAFDPTAATPTPDRDVVTKLHLLAQTQLSSDDYPVVVYARSRDEEASVPLNVSVIGNSSSWQRPVTTPATDQVVAMVGDRDGGVYVAANTTGALSGLKNQGDFDSYVLHYRNNGAVGAVVPLATTSSDVITALAVDAYDNVYAAGFTYGTFNGQLTAGKADGFLAKVGSDGALAWLQQFGTPEIDQLTSVAVGPDGAVYVGGLTEGAFPTQLNAGGSDVFVAKFLPDGTRVFVSQFGTTQDERANGVSNQSGVGIAVDSGGNVFACGSTQGTFAGAMPQGAGDAFFARLSPQDGKPTWLKQIGSVGDDALVSIVAHPNGQVYAAGFTRGPFPGQVQMGGQDGLVVAYRSDGTMSLARQLGTSYADVFNTVSLVNDRLYFVGTTRGAFPGQTQYGGQDVFFLRLSPEGTTMWLRQLGTSQADTGNAIAGAGANLYLGGTTFGDFSTDVALTESDGFLNQYPLD